MTSQVAKGGGIEIRTLDRGDEVERAFVTGYAFAEERGERAVAEYAAQYPMQWSRGLFLDGRLVASLLVLPYTCHVEGAELRTGGIADVACLPEHRRKGYVARLLRDTLADMHERDMVLSALGTPHVPLYRRFGWEVASTILDCRFPTKRAAVRTGPPLRGHAERVSPDDWRRLDRIYNAQLQGRNSGLRRWEQRWRRTVLTAGHKQRDIAVWVDETGEDRGYAVYRETGWRENRRGDLIVREAVALDGEAYRALTAYLLTHDLTADTLWTGVEEEPLFSVLEDPGIVQTERRHGLLFRILDLPAAINVRPCYTARPVSLRFAVQDTDCPWNNGTWRITGELGRMDSHRTSGEPDLSLSIGTLTALYNGFLSPSVAYAAGLMEIGSAAALDKAAALFGTRHRPDCREFF